MTAAIDIQAIASGVKAAQDEVRQIEPVTSGVEGFGMAEAYAVAHRIHEARVANGATSLGRKIGFTNSSLWPKFGVDGPIWGYVYDTTVTHAVNQRVACSLGRFTEPKIEPEIVVHMRETPPADAGVPEILECLDWVAHAFEVVQCHYPGWRFQAPDTVADSALHGALLVGEPVPVNELGADPTAALASFSISLLRGGETMESGVGANVLGGPLQAAAYLVATLATQPEYPALKAGEMVTTGTLTGAYDVTPGETWSTEIEGVALPGLTLEIET